MAIVACADDAPAPRTKRSAEYDAVAGELARRIAVRHDGNLYDDHETMSFDEFGGAVPRVGEFIVEGWLENIAIAEDRDPRKLGKLWRHRTVSVVDAVYYRPDQRESEDDDVWVVLVLRMRSMVESEQALL